MNETMASVPDGWLLLIAVATMLASAVLSAGEAALTRFSRSEAAALVEQGKRQATTIAAFVESPGRVVNASGAVRIVCEMTTAVCITLVLFSTFESWWQAFGVAVVVTVVVSFLIVSISPRSLGRQYPRQVLMLLAPTFTVLVTIMHPVEKIIARIRPVRLGQASDIPVSETQLRDMVDRVTETSDSLEDEDREMIHSVFELGETLTREVMVPRTDMVTIQSSKSLRKALSLFLRSGFSRVPVIGESVDHVLGVLYFKDVVRRLNADEALWDMEVERAMRPAILVPESKPVDDLLRYMQDQETHVALVVDEYGGIAGLVTIEDALEEIVGELVDEHDHDTPEVEDLGGGSFRVPARLSVEGLGELFDIDLDDDDVDTVGGLISKVLGKVPITDSEADIHGIHLVAEEAVGRRKQVAFFVASRSELPEHPDDEAEG